MIYPTSVVNAMKHDAAALKAMKSVRQIPVLTAYTCPVARCLERAGIPVILVGDSVGMVEMGFDSTRDVTMEHMCYHVGGVRRGAPNVHVVADMPYGTDASPAIALVQARRLLEAGADSVKLEGPKYDVIAHLRAHGIDVVGHTGLTPQTAADFKQVGTAAEDAERIIAEARGIAAAGAFMMVLEHIPADLAARVTEGVDVPTIGIGAGAACDGQVLVINDAMGLGDYWPPFSRQYAYVGRTLVDVAESFIKEVSDGTFVNNVRSMRHRA